MGDDKVLRSPGQNHLQIPSRRIAELAASEWDAQEKEINAESMPIHSLLCTALDQMQSRCLCRPRTKAIFFFFFYNFEFD